MMQRIAQDFVKYVMHVQVVGRAEQPDAPTPVDRRAATPAPSDPSVGAASSMAAARPGPGRGRGRCEAAARGGRGGGRQHARS